MFALKIEKTCHSSAEKFNEKLYQKPLKSALIIGALGIFVCAIMGSGKKIMVLIEESKRCCSK